MKLEVGKTYTIIIPAFIFPAQTKILTVQPKPKFVFVEGVEKNLYRDTLKMIIGML